MRLDATVQASRPSSEQRGYWPAAAFSICFWTFSRLKEPGVWLGG
jgi:hypothetical protein